MAIEFIKIYKILKTIIHIQKYAIHCSLLAGETNLACLDRPKIFVKLLVKSFKIILFLPIKN